jgi:hypothetical protein
MYKDGSIVSIIKSYDSPLFALISEICTPAAKDCLKYKEFVDNKEFDRFDILSLISSEEQKKKPGNHLSWWSFEKMKNALEKTGFRIIVRSDSDCSTYNEMRGRDFDQTHPEYSLYIESIK